MIRPLRDSEKDLILEAVIECGSVTRAAALLEISRNRIHRLFRKHGITLKVNEIMSELRKQRKLL